MQRRHNVASGPTHAHGSTVFGEVWNGIHRQIAQLHRPENCRWNRRRDQLAPPGRNTDDGSTHPIVRSLQKKAHCQPSVGHRRRGTIAAMSATSHYFSAHSRTSMPRQWRDKKKQPQTGKRKRDIYFFNGGTEKTARGQKLSMSQGCRGEEEEGGRGRGWPWTTDGGRRFAGDTGSRGKEKATLVSALHRSRIG